MKHQIIKRSFYCGVLTFAINVVFLQVQPILLITSNILPGFVYATVLCDFEDKISNKKRLLFIALAGGLFIFVAWVATGYSFFGENIKFCFPLASVIGSSSLLTFYYILIDQKISFIKGLAATIFIGLLSSIFLPYLVDEVEKKVADYELQGILALGTTLLIFPIWQTLFGWALSVLKKGNCQRHLRAIADSV